MYDIRTLGISANFGTRVVKSKSCLGIQYIIQCDLLLILRRFMKKTIYKGGLDSLNEDLYSLKILEGTWQKEGVVFLRGN